MIKDSKITFKKAVFFFSPILIVIIIYAIVEFYNYYLLNYYKRETTGIITRISGSGIRNEFEINNVEYEYYVDSVKYKGYTSSKISYNYVIGYKGIPVIPGHEYIVYYSSKKPELSEIDFSKPTTKTIEKYIEETSGILIKYKKFENCTCYQLKRIVETLIKLKGLSIIADIYCHNEPPIENFSNNKNTFEKLIKEEIVDSLIRDFCLK